MRSFEFCVVAVPRRSVMRTAVYSLAMVAAMLGMAVALSGCGSRNAFEGTGSPKYTGPDPIPIGGGVYKVGNPYQIAGRTYYPKVEPNYDRQGVASWYGPKFHRRMTANGEWFDQDRVTAAHNTMPLPSFARVTNLKNGKSIIVRVNDRGPYAQNRIIDLSKKSAEILGFRGAGTAPVRVQYVGPAPLSGHDYYAVQASLEKNKVARKGKENFSRVAAASADMTHTGSVSRTRTVSGAPGGGLYIQAGTYGDPNNAARAERRLGEIGNVRTSRLDTANGPLYQVRLGPLSDTGAADDVLARVIAAGHDDARIVSN